MCYAYPGPRCSAHAASALKRAREKYDAIPSESTDLKSASYIDYCEKRDAFYSTPRGQKWLERQIQKTGDPDGSLRLAQEVGANERTAALEAFQRYDPTELEELYEDNSLAEKAPAYLETGWGNVPMTPGVIDAHVQRALTSGYCIPFARALHDKTGYPVVVSFPKGSWKSEEECNQSIISDEYDDIGLIHAMVKTPQGTLLDIEGEHDVEEYCANTTNSRNGLEVYELTPESFDWAENQYGAHSQAEKRLVSSYVEPLLAQSS